MGLFSRSKSKKVEVYEEGTFTIKEPTALYILLEVEKNGIISYLQSHGIMVKAVTTSIDDISIEIMTESLPYRLVVVDYGLGNFQDRTIRASLLGTIESALVEDRVNLFTNSASLRTDITDMVGDNSKIDIFEYSGIVDIVKALTMYPESYDYGGANDFIKEQLEDFKGERVKYEGTQRKLIDIREVIDSSPENDGIVAFKVKF